jgi:copper transport protein
MARPRLGFAFLTALAASWASQEGRSYYWWAAVGVGGALLMTLTQLSHVTAEGGLLTFIADWLHVAAASVWVRGLLGFPLLLIGPLRTMELEETRAGLLGGTVRRFSKVATVAVMTIVGTGVYAVLLHVPSLSLLLHGPYGKSLIMKLGLMVLLLATGGINLIDKGQGPFHRMVGLELVLAIGIFVAAGFLTSVPRPKRARRNVGKNRH